MNQVVKMPRHLGPEKVEGMLGLEPGSLGPIPWLVMQEMAAGKKVEGIAAGLGVSESDLNKLIESVTLEVNGALGEAWQNGVSLLKATALLNEHSIAASWDSVEAMALEALAESVQKRQGVLGVKDSLEIAQAANRAQRRHRGEGQGSRVSVRMGGEGQDAEVELRGGNIGSIRLSLSSRVRQQLEQPRTIDVKANESREMLTLDDTRSIVSDQ